MKNGGCRESRDLAVGKKGESLGKLAGDMQ